MQASQFPIKKIKGKEREKKESENERARPSRPAGESAQTRLSPASSSASRARPHSRAKVAPVD